ncbi:trehalose-6-phosphate synthase [mine drainage metagenome]|uniref:Trehalose-6-phosphate synthase n=1 Tax=mine drainage metagenome TaxID=410659 RepID=T1BFE7_9ZZZZ
MSRLVIVSNRVAIPGRRGGAQGGVATGLFEALRQEGGLWFGWNGRLSEAAPAVPALATDAEIAFALIPLTRREFEGYYIGFANRCLWPVFHAQLHLMRYDVAAFGIYLEVSTHWAEALLPLLKTGDLIWVHDYHLIPLGGALRKKGVAAPIGFFLHTPFPGVDLLRALPGQARLIEQLLAYDLVGFQTPLDCLSLLQGPRIFPPGSTPGAGWGPPCGTFYAHPEFPDRDRCRSGRPTRTQRPE